MMKMQLVLVVLTLLMSTGVSAFELNTLNAIDYNEGETIRLSTKILDNDAFAVANATCSVYVLKDTDNSDALTEMNMTYNEFEEQYEYFWVPELTWWEGIEQLWNPAVGDYHAYFTCTGGLLTRMLIDVVLIQVV